MTSIALNNEFIVFTDKILSIKRNGSNLIFKMIGDITETYDCKSEEEAKIFAREIVRKLEFRLC
jgi:hypothetical protein